MQQISHKLLTFCHNLFRVLSVSIALVSISVGCGEVDRFPDRTGEPLYDESELELVVELDMPPGNISVSDEGRIFITFMPEAYPGTSIAEIVEGMPVSFPDADWQPDGSNPKKFISVLPIRVDLHNRLWLVDGGFHGIKKRVRVMAFDLDTRELVHEFTIPKAVMGIGSYANDFQVSTDGKWIYLTDSGIVNKKPGLIIYDIENTIARRVLHTDPSVMFGPYIPVAQGRAMQIPGIFALNPGADSIALSRDGEWLYYGGFSNEYLYRIETAVLNEFGLPLADVTNAVEQVGEKTMSDGITIDNDDNIYITDPEHDAVVRLSPSGELETLFKTPLLRWPDGFSYGPDNYLYLTCSALHQVFAKPATYIQSKGPFQIYRFDPGVGGSPGQ